MDLLKVFEQKHSKAQCDKIIRYVGNSKERFAELMKVFLKGEYRTTQWAAWPMSFCVLKHPELIRPYFKQIIPLLEKKDVHPAVHRNIVRLLQFVDIPERYQGPVMNRCFEFVESNDTPGAIKAFSLSILQNLAKTYPDIKPELKLIIEERWPYETPAFHSRGRKVLNELGKKS